MPIANVRRDGTGNPQATSDDHFKDGPQQSIPRWAQGVISAGITGSIGRTQMLRNCTGLP
jgi:hypothetical protein